MRAARKWPLVLAAVLLGIASCNARPPEALPAPVDRVVIAKGERRLRLLSDSTVVREYAIALGREPIGHKQREGDDRTRGCIAVTNAEIEEIWALVPDGTPVEIRP